MENLTLVLGLLLTTLSLTTWAQERCGETIHTNWKIGPNHIHFESFKHFPEQICDSGLPLPGANRELILYYGNHRTLYKKLLFFPEMKLSHGESDRPEEDKLVTDWTDYQSVKIPRLKGMETVKSFEIINLEDKKTLAHGPIQF